jgi:hypothetical protein
MTTCVAFAFSHPADALLRFGEGGAHLSSGDSGHTHWACSDGRDNQSDVRSFGPLSLILVSLAGCTVEGGKTVNSDDVGGSGGVIGGAATGGNAPATGGSGGESGALPDAAGGEGGAPSLDAASTPDLAVREDAAPPPDVVEPPPVPDAAPDLAPPPPSSLLYVLGAIKFGTDDILIARLQLRGYTVETATDLAFTAADTNGRAAVLFSASTVSANFKPGLVASLTDMAVPIVVMDENLEPTLAFTGPTVNVDHAAANNQTQVAMVAGADAALRATLTGNRTVYSTMFAIGWGVPGPGALKIATVVGAANHAAVYAYPTGAAMAGGKTAPARRLFYFVRDSNIPNLVTEDGLKLLDAAVAWVVAK